MTDPTDPRAVADDPSGIVQQMPEDVAEVLIRVADANSADPASDDLSVTLAIQLADAEAEIALLRAEVERLRANAKGMRALLRAGCDLLSLESEALRNSVIIIGEPGRLSDDPEDAPTIAAITEIEDWIASVKATLFQPALSPETDGGQDG